MSRKLLTILLVLSISVVAMGADNSKFAQDDGLSGSNNTIIQKQKTGTYDNDAYTLIQKQIGDIYSVSTKGTINQNSPGNWRTGHQTLAGTAITALIKQSGNWQTATQTIKGKGITAKIIQSNKENTATQTVRGIDHEAYITQAGREGEATQTINGGMQPATFEQQ